MLVTVTTLSTLEALTVGHKGLPLVGSVALLIAVAIPRAIVSGVSSSTTV